MALIKCKECGHMISDRATRCPKCGCPVVKMYAEGAPTPRIEESVITGVAVVSPPLPTAEAEPTTQPKTQQPQPVQQQSALQAEQQSPQKEKSGKNIAIVLLSVALIVVIILGLFLFLGDKYPSNAKDNNGDAHTGPTTGTINGHEWVDIGLSVKWATCNVGASSPSDYGNYYGWGETTVYSKENDKTTYSKSMGSMAGNSQYDAARANWGGTWRLPTEDEFKKLVDKCTWKWTTQGGHQGYKVTGPNGNSIFLPAVGWHYENTISHTEEEGHYWSSTPVVDLSNDGYVLLFDEEFISSKGWGACGMSVRPVSD